MLQQSSLTQALAQSQRTPRVSQPHPDTTLGIGWQQVADVLQLPSSIQSFLVFFILLLLVAGAMGMHVMLSVQVMQKQSTLLELQAQQAHIERQNAELVWQINQSASLDQVYQQAMQQGYEPMVERKFVVGERTIVNRLDENEGVALNQP
ncbi:MAG: hypothetical protein U0175_22785 [Caldilineaceae bacterium]